MIKRYVGVDPGEHTGYALLDVDVEKRELMVERTQEFNRDMSESFLIGLEISHPANPIELIVMEDFILFGHKAQAQVGSRIPAAITIGSVRLAAKRMNVPIIMQPQQRKEEGAAMTGKIVKKGQHMPNTWSAYNHLYFYLVVNDIIDNPILTRPPEDNFGGIFG